MERKIVKRDSLSKQISDKLESMIDAGEYQVGERIPTEPELMEMFQVSRNTIREAVQSLTWVGILEIKQGDGTYVRSSNRFRANMKQKYAQVSLEDIKEARSCLEVTIAHLAAIRHEDSDVARMEQAFRRRNSQMVSEKENTKADIEFHMTVAEASHNRILIDLYQSISDYLESHIAERNKESECSVEEIDALHEQLLRAVVDRKPEEAARAVRHIVEI